MADEPDRPAITTLPDGGQRVEGPTPNGGAYAVRYVRDDGSSEIVEFDAEGEAIFRTHASPAGPPGATD